MENKRVIKIGFDEDYAPIQFMSEGKVVGIFPDIIHLVEKNSDFSFEFVIYKDFNRMVDALKNNEIDVVSAVAPLESRREFAYFTDFKFELEAVALARENRNFSSVDELIKDKVALTKGFTLTQKIEKMYPDKSFEYVSTVDEGIKGVSFGNYDVFICELPQASYYVDKLNIVNLKVLHNVDIDFVTDIGFMVDDDQPELLSEFNFILNNLPESEIEDIRIKWISIAHNEWSNLLYVVSISLILILLVAFFIIVWNRSLKKEVSKQTIELQQLFDENMKQKEDLQSLNDSLESIVQERTRELTVVNNELEISLDELKRTQAELLEAKKIASLGSLVMAISHELNTPLGSTVTSNSALIGEVNNLAKLIDANKLSKTKLFASIEKMDKLCELNDNGLFRIKAILDSFKEISITKEGHFTKMLKLEDTIELAKRRSIANNEVDLIIDFESSLMIESDFELLVLVFSNLIENSIDYANLDLEGIKISVREDDKYHIINYYDSSVPIEDEVISQMFEPFHTSDRGGHLGLGLYKVYNIVHYNLNGQITYIKNDEPHFEIRLPKK
jgi:signal transduction histidine kinase